MAIRSHFPPAGSDYQGGTSDGFVFRLVFAGSKLSDTYELVRQFLKEEGYDDLPLPPTAEDLEWFRKRPGQQSLFEKRGYIHFPIKVFFDSNARRKNWLVLEIHNSEVENALMRFHGMN